MTNQKIMGSSKLLDDLTRLTVRLYFSARSSSANEHPLSPWSPVHSLPGEPSPQHQQMVSVLGVPRVSAPLISSLTYPSLSISLHPHRLYGF